jgi:hypothetical protein
MGLGSARGSTELAEVLALPSRAHVSIVGRGRNKASGDVGERRRYPAFGGQLARAARLLARPESIGANFQTALAVVPNS